MELAQVSANNRYENRQGPRARCAGNVARPDLNGFAADAPLSGWAAVQAGSVKARSPVSVSGKAWSNRACASVTRSETYEGVNQGSWAILGLKMWYRP